MSEQISEATRRDFLYVWTTAFALTGSAFAMWPFVDQMNPSADVIAAGLPLEVDLSPLDPGQQMSVLWRGKPIFIVYRSEAALNELKNADLLARLRDPNSTARQQPDYAENWSRASNPKYFVAVGVCTHLGCVPMFEPKKGSIAADWPGGYFCPCHGSKYDLAGRVFIGVPAPFNLPVPPYRFKNPTTLVIGENPPGHRFSLADVKQI